ncbi:MAG: dihydrofolate reductase [Paenibacillus macerans]|uniref:dihydrofolate reductase n=1 Tax=Paenibacillus TaxID=44249 RepID=UPI002907F7A3|nr:dihydrofolate reductase [Paenibacillus macerans]MDU7472341.1 dihydrofolate reductase [Paenibacillus macerans]
MKTILWATLAANGNYAQSGPENPPTKEALADFAAQAKAAGNFIVGRRTFESIAGNGGGGGPFADLDIVVISNSIPNSANIHNSFLGQELVDEVIFNVAPVLEGKGLNLLIDKDHYRCKHVELLDCKPLGGGVVQLRYAINR